MIKSLNKKNKKMEGKFIFHPFQESTPELEMKAYKFALKLSDFLHNICQCPCLPGKENKTDDTLVFVNVFPPFSGGGGGGGETRFFTRLLIESI